MLQVPFDAQRGGPGYDSDRLRFAEDRDEVDTTRQQVDFVATAPYEAIPWTRVYLREAHLESFP
jgi:hypothetical protein